MKAISRILILILVTILITGCAEVGQTEIKDDEAIPLIETLSTFEIPVPTASGVNVEQNDRAMIDYSNAQNGYIIVKFYEISDTVLRVAVTSPHDERYIYALKANGNEEVIPLTEGDGEYKIGIYEHYEGDTYNAVVTAIINVEFQDEFLPFVHPNQFVNFTKDSELVQLATELTKDAHTVEHKIAAIYNYVVENFTYDYDLAATVQSGYLPDLDNVLHRKEGICFDYSALLTAMLRSQGIPARLEIGYFGEQYHAWISKFCEHNGWIEKRFNHDGNEWQMMDPTMDSNEHVAYSSRKNARNHDDYRLMFNY